MAETKTKIDVGDEIRVLTGVYKDKVACVCYIADAEKSIGVIMAGLTTWFKPEEIALVMKDGAF